MLDLEEQIRNINNHLEFVKICNTYFTALYRENFQIIDGTRGDQGNDGYIISEKRLLAIYCPTKPEKVTDQKYINKIYGDLKKAGQLNEKGTFKIEKWTFITPEKLTTDIIAKLRKKAQEYNFEGNHIESTTLANLFYEKPELIKKFSYLHLPKIEEEIAEIKYLITNKKISKKAKHVPITNLEEENHKKYKETDDFKKVIKIITKNQEEDSKSTLRGIYYQTTDKVAQINIILSLLRWFDPLKESNEDMIEWCEQGLLLAKDLNGKILEALFLSNKGYFLSVKYSELDLNTATRIRMQNMTGVTFITEDQRKEVISQLYNLEKNFNDSFNEAIKIAKALNQPSLLADILLRIGQSAGIRFIHLDVLKVYDGANYEKNLSKRALLAAKNIYEAIGDELKVGLALHNLALELFSFREITEANELNEKTIEIATKHKDESLLQAAKWLSDNLKRGAPLDYVHGKRRGLKK